jgi:hypothetical protein
MGNATLEFQRLTLDAPETFLWAILINLLSARKGKIFRKNLMSNGRLKIRQEALNHIKLF